MKYQFCFIKSFLNASFGRTLLLVALVLIISSDLFESCFVTQHTLNIVLSLDVYFTCHNQFCTQQVVCVRKRWCSGNGAHNQKTVDWMD